MLSREEIMQALDGYLANYVESQNEYFGDRGFDDLHGMADAVYDRTAEALHHRGFVIQESGLQEDSDQLTIEDVLLPKPDQGADLTSDVTKADVVDSSGKHGKPDQAYTSRLMTLAGMQSGY